ncbi:LysM peptidoglycan-binding domain-containing protein [Nocardioides cheoyonin]|jgi:LysM repeat protein|uniref:LysM peptidoglycan-binding domain-containing protein n=1 Tax=Nocardioides cheoyonin TaxID=3156615 RepID=UPI0032B312F3
MSTLTTRLRGLAATLALVAFVLGVPAVLLAIHAIPDPAEFSWSRVTSPDDGTLALQVIAIVCWIAWAIFTCQLIASIISRIRGMRAPRLPGLVVPQLAADRLVAAAALLFVAVPTVTALLPQPRAEAAVTATPLPAAPVATAPGAAQAAAEVVTHHAAPTKQEPATERYTVKRGDSLWKIAEEHLGDGTRYVELLNLNEPVLGGRPDFLIPGTILKVPVPEVTPESEYVVQPGDTLSEISEEELGDANAYPEIFDASRATIQPDGEHLTDPDLIRPGWQLTIPEAASPPQATPPKHRDPVPPRTPQQRPSAADPGPSIRLPQAPADQTTEVAATQSASDLPSWVLPGLAGGGAAFAGALLLVLRQHRRTQLRYRRPGRIIAPPPRELRPSEKSAQASGSITAPQIEHLDRALRGLGDPSTSCPRVASVTLASSEINLRLAAPAELSRPWTGSGADWTLGLESVPAERPGTVAPYPLLVSVGMAQQGGLIFVNLEELRSVVLVGDTNRAEALGRHIAAELSLNPWSQLVEIDTVGIGRELADIDPLRLHLHADSDTAFLDRLAADLEASDATVEPDRYRALIAASRTSDPEPVRRVAKVVTSYAGRAGAAVITVDGEPDAATTVFELTSDGRLKVADLGLDLTAAGLTAEEAQACATLVDLTRDAVESNVPQLDDPTTPSDAGGALTAAYVEARPKEERAGNRSLLPDQTATYAETSATTTDDVEILAPLATAAARTAVRDDDPRLDEDLARWESSVLVAPKLTLLGPVTARTTGDAKQVAKRRPFYVELLAYLTLHPNGVTASEVADAFGITKERARTDLSILRHWLGEDPRTGEPHLPDARAQRDRADRGAVYATNGVLNDLDLFRRLRSRGQAEGEKGLDDLVTALSLVTGEPFSEHRGTGWGWLLDGERTDHIMTCAIVDVAHIVTTHALATNQLDLARFSAETAYRAAPYDETSRLDLIDVAAATGHSGAAQKQLVDDVLNRSDDGLGPIEIPDRTAEVIRQRGWPATETHRERRA